MMSIDPLDRYLDPPEQEENPRCPGCDEQMDLTLAGTYICIDPDCSQCDPAFKDQEGDDGICVNCNEVLVFKTGTWTHYEDGISELSTCTNPQPRRKL